MRNLFNLDGPLMQLINKVVYSVYLNPMVYLLHPHCNNRGVNHRAFLCHIEDSQE